MTVNKEMVHRFPTAPAHTTSICQWANSKHEIIQCKNVIMSCRPWKKKATLLGTFSFQMPFQGKIELGVVLNSL